jgi:integrase
MAKRRGAGEGAICQCADGRWVAVLDLGTVAGKRRRKSLYGKTQREVVEKLRAAQRDQADGLTVAPERMIVRDYLERWLADAARPSVRPVTFAAYRSVVRARVLPTLGNRKLKQVTPLDLQELYRHLQEGGLAARSVAQTHRVLHIALAQAVRWQILPRNPADGVAAPRYRKREFSVLTMDQAAHFLDTTRDHPQHALYVVALTTGMRQCELLGLRWADVDLDAGRLRVCRALQRGNPPMFTEPKTPRSHRTILLSQRAVAALRSHRTRQLAHRLRVASQWEDYDLVFPNAYGRPQSPRKVLRVFQTALRHTGLPVLRFHDLRHTAATLLLTQGVHPKVVSEMLGHASIALTLDTYSHLVPVLHEQAAGAMDRMLGA